MSYSSEVLADSPLIYARLGGADTAAVLVDSSGLGHNAGGLVGNPPTLAQPSLLTSDPGNLSARWNGDGSMQWDQASWQNVASMTLEAWANITALSGSLSLWDRDWTGRRIFQFNIGSDGKLDFIFWTSGGGPNFCNGTTTLAIGTTYHLVVTYNAATGVARLYVNGVEDGTLTGDANPMHSGDTPLGIASSAGGTAGPNYNRFTGRLDEVAYYGSALSAARVLAHYTAGTNEPEPPVVVPGFDYRQAASVTHAPKWRVSMLNADGTPIHDALPFTGGSITKDATQSPRCRATVDIPTQPVPGLMDQTMIPTGQRLRFEYSIAHYDQWLTVADLDVVRSSITRPDSVWRLEAVDRSVRIGLDDTARGGWVPQTTGTIGDAIKYIVNRTFPNTVFDITGPALTQTVPADSKTYGDTWQLAQRFARAAGSELFFNAHDRVCVVRPVADLGDPVDTLSVGAAGTVTAYELQHELGFNAVALRYVAIGGDDVLRTGLWVDTRTGSPVAIQRIGSHVVYVQDEETVTAPSQAEADAAAAAIARRAAGRARSPSIRHVARPWIEPGHTVQVTYIGGPTELQLVDAVQLPLDNTNIQVTTLRTHEYSMEVPV